MKTETIPLFIRQVYTYFGIPQDEFAAHYQQDCYVRGAVRGEVARVYRLLFNELKDARKIK